jgi:hypothetical protein
VRKVFQLGDDHSRLVDPGAAVHTITNVSLQGVGPEAHLVIVEEEIDLVWKKVPVIHGSSGGLTESVRGWFQKQNGWRAVER